MVPPFLQRQQRRGARSTALALCLVGALGFSIGPVLWLSAKAKGADTLTTKSDKPLPAQAAIRGQYMNIGSKDIGPDLTNYNKYPKKDKAAAKKKAKTN